MDVKVGDVVHVRMYVKDAGRYSKSIDAIVDGQEVTVPISAIVHVEPRPLAVGDEVRVSGYNSGCGAIILAIDGDEAWLKWKHNTSRFIAELIQLTRVNLVP